MGAGDGIKLQRNDIHHQAKSKCNYQNLNFGFRTVIYDTSPKQGQLLVEAAACFNNKTTFCLQIKCLSTTLTLDLEEESSCVGQNAEA